ncbi:MAG: nucleoside deaminase [Clostridia bacterium]|nr:nucleoside deaminase [Clostridia bacterium]
MSQEELDLMYMRKALELAREAAEADEVPVGALIVYEGRIIAAARNRRETDKMATHHAEICAIEEACRVRGGWRLPDCTLYVTLEPCPMCGGAIVNARLPRVVFGAYDHRGGVFGSATDFNALTFNHRPDVTGGVLAEEAAAILSAYFKKKRNQRPTDTDATEA